MVRDMMAADEFIEVHIDTPLRRHSTSQLKPPYVTGL
jgi:adenylylsulfate kinase-like enzyme